MTMRTHDPLDKRLRARLRRERNEHCPICEGRLGPILYDTDDHLNPLAFQLDHVVPLARGGQKVWSNVQPAHRTCNRAKSDRMPGDRPGTPRPSTTTTPAASCPPGPCTRCRGTHHPRPGVTFITSRQW